MADADFLGKGWKYPVAPEKGQIAVSQGDTLIKESVWIILGTDIGERVMRPDFGCRINELVFAPNNTTTTTLVSYYVRDALLKWEPRIDVLEVKTYPDNEEQNRLIIEIEYRVKTNNSKHNLVYPFYLERAGK
ncbi:MAG TPA: GPW/gp25 family protein [Bacillota bacterium]|nr:GPW/gp25 family protein [Bacillota bacterium]